jgi:LacI family transcriptional regulator
MVRISHATRDAILAAAKELDYQPQAAGRALVTGRTFNIGFILSSKTSLGLSNPYFSSIMSGCAAACKQRGYNCSIGTHDLSSAKDYVTPSKIRNQSVDGVIICGRVEDEIVKTFVDYDLPFVLVGQSSTYPRERILSVSEDISRIWLDMIEYLHNKGHRDILIGGIYTSRLERLMAESIKQFNKKHGQVQTQITGLTTDYESDQLDQAYKAGLKWAASSNKATALVANAHFCLGFIGAIEDAGYSYPHDISIISTTDELFCRCIRPTLTTLTTPLHDNGALIADLLIDYVEKKCTLKDGQKKAALLWNVGALTERNSVRQLE